MTIPKTTLSKTTLSIYGMTGLPLALVGYPIAIWLPAFYAGEINISLAAVATMLLVAKLTDVVTDPLVGAVSDRLRTPIGRRRPVILLGSWTGGAPRISGPVLLKSCLAACTP